MNESIIEEGRVIMSEKEAGHFQESLKYIRDRLDSHIEKQHIHEQKVLGKIAEIKEESSINKSRIVGISTTISVIVAAFISWVLSHLKG